MNKRIVTALVASAVMIFGCTVGPKDSEGNPIPTGPNPSIEPDHPPKPKITDNPNVEPNIISVIITASRGPVLITGSISGNRRNGPPTLPIHGRIGSGGGSFKGYLPYEPGTRVGLYVTATYNGGGTLDDLTLKCELIEVGHETVVTFNSYNTPTVECATSRG